MFAGLRVVTVEGARPRVSALLIRNLLRVIDVFPFPLAAIILRTPLRQRVGDLAAGTIVVLNAPAEES